MVYPLEPVLTLLPQALHTPLIVVVGAHAVVLAIWLLLFVKDIMMPPKLSYDKQD